MSRVQLAIAVARDNLCWSSFRQIATAQAMNAQMT
jgi:hypothetical protein